jgi:hypothetical protein
MDIVQNSNFNCDYFPPSSVPYRIYLHFFSVATTNCLIEFRNHIADCLENLPASYGARRFFTVFTRALHWSLS